MKCKSCNQEGFKNPREIVLHKRAGCTFEQKTGSTLRPAPGISQQIQPGGETTMESFDDQGNGKIVIESKTVVVNPEPTHFPTINPVLDPQNSIVPEKINPEPTQTVNPEIEARIEANWQKKIEDPDRIQLKQNATVPQEGDLLLNEQMQVSITLLQRLQNLFQKVRSEEAKRLIGELMVKGEVEHWNDQTISQYLFDRILDSDDRAGIREVFGAPHNIKARDIVPSSRQRELLMQLFSELKTPEGKSVISIMLVQQKVEKMSFDDLFHYLFNKIMDGDERVIIRKFFTIA